ncbi:MAG TPA: pirin family protein [Rhodocyclaceae bacterium]|nr:pirin family protein [Rhodocyclaceae bacterium]
MALTYREIDAQNLHYLPASRMHPADTFFHFSFANYYNPENMNFGVLRVLNDDDVLPHSGFGKHPHRDMEIVSYVVSGELTHWDSATGVEDTLERGHVQTVTAGSGVWHSEMNNHAGHTRFLQIWIQPPADNLPVRYENRKFDAADRLNKLLQIVGNPGNQDEVSLHLNQDVNLYVSEITDLDARVSFSLKAGRQAYINNFEGSVDINGIATLAERDSLEIIGPAELDFSLADERAHFIIIEMAASETQQ